MDGNESARRLAKAACALDGAYDRLAKRLGITGNLLWLLYILDDGAPHSQKQICEEWLFPKTTVNTLTKECQGAGYITSSSPMPGGTTSTKSCGPFTRRRRRPCR